MKISIKKFIAGVLISMATAATTLANEIKLPSMGTDVASRLSNEEEIQLGSAFMRSVRLQLPISEDPEVLEYIWSLGYDLVSNSDFKSKPFHFFVVNESIINAFAGPGGYIGVNAGLILASEDESELAGVIAHEIAHVTQKHLDRAFTTAEKLTLPTAAAIVAAILLGGKDINLAEAALAATLAANIQTQLNFTRKHEVEADHVGILILTAAKYDPFGMPHFFERLQQQDRLYSDQLPEFLRTHPVTINRIAESKSRAARYRFTPKAERYEYALIKEKLRVANANDYVSLIKAYEANQKAGKNNHKHAQQYGYALALYHARQLKQAKTVIETLIKKDRPHITYTLLLARIDFALEKSPASLSQFADILKLYPRNRAATIYYAESLHEIRKLNEAKQLLLSQINNRPTPTVYELLAKIEGESNRPGSALQMLSEFYFMYGQTHTAIEQLNLALRQKDIDKIETARIEQRLEELKKIAIMERSF